MVVGWGLLEQMWCWVGFAGVDVVVLWGLLE